MNEDITREVLTAIAVLQNDISYIKIALDELKKEDCSDCDPAKAIKGHIAHHKNSINWLQWVITGVLSGIAILVSFVK